MPAAGIDLQLLRVEEPDRLPVDGVRVRSVEQFRVLQREAQLVNGAVIGLFELDALLDLGVVEYGIFLRSVRAVDALVGRGGRAAGLARDHAGVERNGAAGAAAEQTQPARADEDERDAGRERREFADDNAVLFVISDFEHDALCEHLGRLAELVRQRLRDAREGVEGLPTVLAGRDMGAKLARLLLGELAVEHLAHQLNVFFTVVHASHPP